MVTPKQARFIEQYLVDLNATQAAIRAGYSASNADKIGSQLLAKPAVAAAVDQAKLARSIETGVDNRYVLRTLVERAEADLRDLFDPKTNDLLPIDQWPPVWRTGLVQSVEIEVLFDGQGKNRIQIGHTKKVRLADRTRILELIGKHIRVGAFQETVKVSGFDGLGARLERAFNRIDSAKLQSGRKRAGPKPSEDTKPLPSGRLGHAI
jgi:phage terminase small subunit